MLVPFGDSARSPQQICGLLRDEPRRQAMGRQAYMLGREMIWSHVAHLYMNSFQQARRVRFDRPVKPLAIQTLDERRSGTPEVAA